jgi:maleylpyruvate isomerase
VTSLGEARSALRVRLGNGARYDDPAAPAKHLAWARLGTAYFARKLNELTDSDLFEPENGVGLVRRRIIARVSYQARGLAQYLEWARQGSPREATDPFANIGDDVMLAVTLPAGALRHLFQHSEIHLNVEWRDLDATAWEATFVLNNGRSMTARDTAWIRARTIWESAVDLQNGARLDDFPPELVDALPHDRTRDWTGDTIIDRPEGGNRQNERKNHG